MKRKVHGECSLFGLLAGHAQMVRNGMAAFALLSLARSIGTGEPIQGVVPCVLRADNLSVCVFLGSILGIPLLELELSFALDTLTEVAHLPNGFVGQVFELGAANESSYLVLHHELVAAHLEAPEVPALVDELRVDVLVDAGHAEDVPAVVDIEEDVSVEVLVVLPIAVRTIYDFALVNSYFIHRVLHFHAGSFRRFLPIHLFLPFVLLHNVA